MDHAVLPLSGKIPLSAILTPHQPVLSSSSSSKAEASAAPALLACVIAPALVLFYRSVSFQGRKAVTAEEQDENNLDCVVAADENVEEEFG
ncbi:hypothetical protein LR48_Vigan208s000200 [Vigna angularis]|uniref:Uncharacterized protein n=1 Tax=Phaseolus angularis TaxID=3914 RepID=A0A0L9T784_PHAAN|nr:hypothetical protein LR48_Vigan208s000200 [Vigna angularis]